MTEILFGVLFGWPAALVTAILAMIGLLIAAAILALPFSWLLSGSPVIKSPVFLLPLLLFASGFYIYRGRKMVARLLAIPYFLTIW